MPICVKGTNTLTQSPKSPVPVTVRTTNRNRTRLELAVLPRRITKEGRNWPLIRRLTKGWQICHGVTPKPDGGGLPAVRQKQVSAAEAEAEAESKAEAEAETDTGTETEVFVRDILRIVVTPGF